MRARVLEKVTLSVVILVAAQAALSQNPAIALKKPNGTLDEPFTAIGAVRELQDGRVIITDARERRMVVATFGRAGVDTIGRVGRGPGEYLGLSPFYAIGGDSSMLLDAMNRRWLLLDGARIVKTVPPDHPGVLGALGVARGVDRFGHFLNSPILPMRAGTFEAKDPEPLYLVSRATGQADTIERLLPVPQIRRAWADDQGRVTQAFTSRAAFAVGDAAILATDGWVAIVRLNPYRVEWRTPDGKMIRGRPVSFTPVAVDAREKKYYLERNAAAVATQSSMPPTVTDEFRKLAEEGRMRLWTEFPATIPPFEPGPLLTSSASIAYTWR